MDRVSYSQNREDVVLARAFGNREHGFYIDVGAWHPIMDSVTCFFYRRGWRGVNIEPLPFYFELLEAERPEDVNLCIGIARARGEQTFYEDLAASGLSTFVPSQAARLRDQGHELRELQRPVLPLAEVCEEHVDGEIDFLKIDVEGAERAVLESGDWDRWRPRVVLVEATAPEVFTEVHREWEGLLLDAGYLFALFDGLNRFFVRTEDRALLALLDRPACVLDHFVPYVHLQRVEELQRQIAALEAVLREHERTAEGYAASLRQSLAEKEEEIRRLLDDIRRREAETRKLTDSLQASLAAKEREVQELERRLAAGALASPRAQNG